MARRRVLLLTSKTGGGHLSLSDALRDRLEGEFDCTIVDPQPTFFHTHYRLVSRHALWLWQAEYAFGDRPDRAVTAQRLFARLVVPQLRMLLAEIRPDVMIGTYSMLAQAMVAAAQGADHPVATALLIADPQNVHATWLAVRGIDCLLAPTRETAAQALAAGFTQEQVQLCGWPVRRQFVAAAAPDDAARAAALRDLGLEPGRFTVFLQGGGEGTARFARTVEAVLDAEPRVQILLATGTNAGLQARFAATPRVHALAFTKEIARYMQLGDVVMGKAGPNMLFEAVTLGKPFIATTYIPGQESPNLDFIRRHQLGWVALTAAEQRELIRTLCADPALLAVQTAAVAAYRAWNAAQMATLLPQVRRLVGQVEPVR